MGIYLEIFKKLLKSFRISNMSVYTFISDSFVYVNIMLPSCYHHVTIFSTIDSIYMQHVTTIFYKMS